LDYLANVIKDGEVFGMLLPLKRMVRNRVPTVRSRWYAAPGLLVVAGALALAAALASATTYKWTDANGRVVYSDQPPSGNFNVESISAPPPPANPNAVKELASKEAALQQRRQLRAEEESKAAKARVDGEKKRDQCGKARGQIAVMQSDQIVYQTNAKGEQVFLDNTARRKERDQLTAWVKENCAG
jgi:Skp family chaperone for outer membrane proteins